MTQLTIDINNDNLIPSLVKTLKSIAGVVSVKTHREEPDDALTDPETGKKLNDKTMRLIRRLEKGKEKTYSYDNMEELKKDLLS